VISAVFCGMVAFKNDRCTYSVVIDEIGRSSTLRYRARVIGAGIIGEPGTLDRVKRSAERSFREKVEDWSDTHA
jgi:hypothetical protein